MKQINWKALGLAMAVLVGIILLVTGVIMIMHYVFDKFGGGVLMVLIGTIIFGCLTAILYDAFNNR